jgi:hypothetical protein
MPTVHRQYYCVAALALKRGKSVVFAGYWQRHVDAAFASSPASPFRSHPRVGFCSCCWPESRHLPSNSRATTGTSGESGGSGAIGLKGSAVRLFQSPLPAGAVTDNRRAIPFPQHGKDSEPIFLKRIKRFCPSANHF